MKNTPFFSALRGFFCWEYKVTTQCIHDFQERKSDGFTGLILLSLKKKKKISHGFGVCVCVGLKMFLMQECDTLLPEELKLVS